MVETISAWIGMGMVLYGAFLFTRGLESPAGKKVTGSLLVELAKRFR